MVFVLGKLDRRFAHFRRTGDPDALAFVFDHTAGRLLRVALWLCRHRADAEDVVQRTFLQAIVLRQQFEPGRKVLPWLLGLLSHQVHRLRREREQQRREDAVAFEQRTVDPVAAAAAIELRDAVRAVRAKLSEPYRDVLELHLEQGLDAGEIAQRLGRKAGTVRTQLMRALELLRKKLPSGFVAGFAPLTLDGPLGLGTVRIVVIEAARRSVPLATAIAGSVVTAGIGGVVVGKKLLVVLPVVAILLGVAMLRPWSQDSNASPAAAPAPAIADLVGKAPADVGARAPQPTLERQLVAAPAALPEGTAHSLDVVVFDNREQPVEGALVVLSKDGIEPLAEATSPAGVVGVTDAEGKLHVADAPAFFRYVGAVKPGHGVATFKSRGWTDAVRLRLFVIDAVLQGRVERHDGTGAGGAKVELNQHLVYGPPSADVNLGGIPAVRVVDADADGRFSIAVSSGWGNCSLRASTSNNYSKVVTVHTNAEGETRDVRIVMPGRVELHGLLLDWRGMPAANVRVLAFEVRENSQGERFGQNAATDPSGRFAVPLYDEGTYEVGALCERGHPRSDTLRVQVQADGSAPVTLHLVEPARVEGRVQGFGGNDKITVSARLLPEQSLECEVQVDDKGRFVLENLARGSSYDLSLVFDEHCLVSAQTIAGSGEVVELRNPAGDGAVTVELKGDGVAGLPAGERRSVMLVALSAEGEVQETIAERAPAEGPQVVFEHPKRAANAIAVLLVDGTERARSAAFAIDDRRIEAAIQVRPLGVIELEGVAAIPVGTMVFAKVQHGDGLPLLRGGGARLRQGQPWRCTVQAGDYVLRVVTETPGQKAEVVDLPCRVIADQTTRVRVP